jgi:hypothetical protein
MRLSSSPFSLFYRLFTRRRPRLEPNTDLIRLPDLRNLVVFSENSIPENSLPRKDECDLAPIPVAIIVHIKI